MENKKAPPAVKAWGKYMKGKLVFARIIGLVFCLVCAGTMALLYFDAFPSPWLPTIMLSFSIACIFLSNAFLQSIKVGKGWYITNLVIAFLCYAAVIVFVVMAYLDGAISLIF